MTASAIQMFDSFYTSFCVSLLEPTFTKERIFYLDTTKLHGFKTSFEVQHHKLNDGVFRIILHISQEEHKHCPFLIQATHIGIFKIHTSLLSDDFLLNPGAIDDSYRAAAQILYSATRETLLSFTKNFPFAYMLPALNFQSFRSLTPSNPAKPKVSRAESSKASKPKPPTKTKNPPKPNKTPSKKGTPKK